MTMPQETRRSTPALVTNEPTNVQVKFKLFTEYTINPHETHGRKGTAEDISSGYAYIYRELRDDESNDDGTRTRLFWYCDLSKRTICPLSRDMGGKINNYFFFYSRILLTEPRTEAIRLDLDTFIQEQKRGLNSATICRAFYVPLTPATVNRRYLFGNLSVDQHVDFPVNGGPAVVYLYDWYGYLERLTEAHQNCLKRYDELSQSTVDISKYNTNKNLSGLYDYSKIENENFEVGGLYYFTKSIKKLIEDDRNRITNMRMHDDFVSEEARETGDIRGIKGFSDYRDFLNEYDGPYNEIKAEGFNIAADIVKLYATDRRRNVHSMLADYFFKDSGEREEAVGLFVKSTEKISLFLYDAPDSRYYEKFSDFIKNDIFMTESNLYEVIELQRNSSDYTAAELHRYYGDRNCFWYFLNLQFISDSMAELSILMDMLDPFIAGMQYERQVKIFKALKTRQNFRPLGELGRAVNTDEKRVIQWYKKWYKKTHHDTGYLSISVDEKLDAWENFQKEKFRPFYGDEVRIARKTDNQFHTLHVEVPMFVTETNELRRRIRDMKPYADKAVDGFCAILAIFNIIETAGALTQNEADGLTSIPIMLDSFYALVELPLMQIMKNNIAAKQIGGSIGAGLLALVNGFESFRAFQNDDDDAGLLYGMAAGLAVTAALVSAISGVGMAFYLASGFSIVFSMLANMTTDDNTDIFLKYSIWGNKYRTVKENTRFPSWWPLNRRMERRERPNNIIHISRNNIYEIRSGRAQLLWEVDKNNSSDTLKNNNDMLCRLLQLPPYTITTTVDENSYDHLNIIEDHMVIKIDELVEISRIEYISVQLYKERNYRTISDADKIFEKPLLFDINHHEAGYDFNTINTDDFQAVENPGDFLYDRNGAVVDPDDIESAKSFRVHVYRERNISGRARSRRDPVRLKHLLPKGSIFTERFVLSNCVIRAVVTFYYNGVNLLPVRFIDYYS